MKLPILLPIQAWAIPLFLAGLVCPDNVANRCFFGLGLESGQILDSQISASVNTTSPTSGRLNQDADAWCFRSSSSADEVFFSVDLGEVHLISGFQSQGPPQSKHGLEYLRYVGLRVALSVDGAQWWDCCGDLFYADDKSDSQNVISTHSFHRVEAARFVRISASSGVRWVGHDEKCFRFEVLGCALNDVAGRFQPEIQLMFHPLPAGFLDIQWTPPEIEIAHRERVRLDSERYLVIVSHIVPVDPLTSTQLNLSAPGFISANPLFGSDYVIDISCVHRGFVVNCGSYVKSAQLKASSDCFLHVAPCPISERVDFLRPNRFHATSLEDGSVVVKWTNARQGWRSPKTRLRVEDGLENVIEEVGDAIERTITLPSLKSSTDYALIFTPHGEHIPKDILEHTGSLILMTQNNSASHHSFVADVDFQAHIQWSGQIRAKWEAARAVMENRTASSVSEITVSGYVIRLQYLGGEDDLQVANLSYTDQTFSFGGILMDRSYQVVLECLFDERAIPCGTSVIATTHPAHFVESNSSMSLYVETSLPDHWLDLETECIASGGHLVSLDHYYLEEALARRVNLSSYWSGGNICPNSPAPPDSMWSDGSAELSTNFAFRSGLDGGHCCVKVDIDNFNPETNSSSVWIGEDCSTYLHGICEFKVKDYLDTPKSIRGTRISPQSINLTWTGEQRFWQPLRFLLVYCHVRHLSPASISIQGNSCRYDTTSQASHVLENLETFSEYNVSIIGQLPPFEQTTSAHGTVRTLPKSEVDWIITPQGHLIVSWLKKIAEFKEHDPVLLEISSQEDNTTSNYNGTGERVEVMSLHFGGHYQLMLKASAHNETYGPFHIQAYPNCSSGMRMNLSCVHSISKPHPGLEADQACQLPHRGADLRSPSDSTNTSDIVWLGSAQSRRRHPRSEAEPQNRSDAIRFPENGTDSKNECQAWSIRHEKLLELPCGRELPVLCRSDLPVTSNAPNQSSLRVIPGPTHILLSWDTEDQGWPANYTIKVTPKARELPLNAMDPNATLNREGRQENNASVPLEFQIESSSGPPINLTNLWPESEYSVEIVTSLGPKWKTTLELDSLFTTANNSKLPEEIVGYTMVADDYQTAQFSVLSFVMAILLVSIIIFVLSGTLSIYSDNAMQVCFEISLLLFTLSILLAGTDGPLSWNPEDQSLCAVAVGLIGLCTLSALSFLLFESLCIAHKLVSWVRCPLIENTLILVLLGFLGPLVYVSIAVPLLFRELVPQHHRMCWLNVSDQASAVFLVPISLLFVGAVVLLLISLFGGSEERLQSASYHIRSSTLRFTRYVLLGILALLGLTLGLGLSAAQLASPALLVVFMIFLLTLAAVILGLRCLMDKQVRLQMKRWRKSNEELGETYHTQGGSRLLSRSAYSRKSIASSRSRKSLVGHNQVAPQTRQSITPVESEEDSLDRTNPKAPTPEPFMPAQRETVSSRIGRMSRQGSSSTTRTTLTASSSQPQLGLGSSHSTWKRGSTSTMDCEWRHSRNAIWQELANQSPRSASNRQALRRFRRICSEQYTPILLRSHGAAYGSGSPSLADQLNPPAKYVSPFGESDMRPVLPDAHGRLRSAGLKDAYFSLPNTPDTEDPLRRLGVMARPMIQLGADLGGESYI